MLSNPNGNTSGSLVELERTVIRLGVYIVFLVLPANLQYLIITNSVLIKLLSQSGKKVSIVVMHIQRFGRKVTNPLYDTLFPSDTLADYCRLTVEIPTVNGSLMVTAQTFLVTHIIAIWREILLSPLSPFADPYLHLSLGRHWIRMVLAFSTTRLSVIVCIFFWNFFVICLLRHGPPRLAFAS